MGSSATRGSSLTNFYFSNKYLSNTRYVPGTVPKRPTPREDADRRIMGIQYMFIEGMRECRKEGKGSLEGKQ